MSKAAEALARIITEAILLDPMSTRNEIGKSGLEFLERSEREIAALIDAHPDVKRLVEAAQDELGHGGANTYRKVAGSCSLCTTVNNWLPSTGEAR